MTKILKLMPAMNSLKCCVTSWICVWDGSTSMEAYLLDDVIRLLTLS